LPIHPHKVVQNYLNPPNTNKAGIEPTPITQISNPVPIMILKVEEGPTIIDNARVGKCIKKKVLKIISFVFSQIKW
jgi:hypothetical protein